MIREFDLDKDGCFPSVLVGNKKDLEEEREVMVEQGVRKGEAFSWKVRETSAKTREGVEEVFEELVREIIEYKIERGDETLKMGERGERRRWCVLL